MAIVSDVISAGSAVGGTIKDILGCGGVPVAIGALVTLSESPAQLAAENDLPLEAIASLSGMIWTRAECPLCAEGRPLSQPPPSA